jgi:acyl-CoA thioester hydrolase
VKGAPRPHEVRVELEVPFHDVDVLGIVWHGHYLKYFEVARTRLLRSIGLDAGEVIGARYQLMISESRCRHVRPLRYGDRFEVVAWLGDTMNRVTVKFQVDKLEPDVKCATGHTTLVTLDLDGRLLHRTPDAILDRIRS